MSQADTLQHSHWRRGRRSSYLGKVFICFGAVFLVLMTLIDGSNLHRLSRKFNVRTSFVSDPLSLAVKGVRESVERLARYIRAFKTVRIYTL
jgi:hypothetical protein